MPHAAIAHPAAGFTRQFAEDVRAGLEKPGQKELPSKYFYDAVGSALFEVISLLPEYGLTRAGERVLRQHAEEITSRVAQPVVVAELGSGSGRKTRLILETIARRQPTLYHPIELSGTALSMCEREMNQLESVSVLGFETGYLDGLRKAASRRKPGQHLLVLFLGSSIGNFERKPAEEFLKKIREILTTGDALLLATDLVKPADQLLKAYDDPLGVTAAFNLNLLSRINRELEGDFDLQRFRHLAVWNEHEHRIEMHLASTVQQTVTIRESKLAVSFEKGETIWTESSHKYAPEEIIEMAGQAGFRCDGQWFDDEWLFAENLFVPS
jgi:dimethylhistidine N-methyltransferase